ncbi:MAG: response regulator [Candidatus Omnitrophica bacterium]|nr:response regulator [Candidatus Omnitrophota bacterium]
MGEQTNRPIRILLIDDEADFTQPMSFWLRSKGYSVDVASNGQDALKLIKESCPDIVFLDLNMPVMDGVQTLKKIRGIMPELPVIIVSAYADDPRMVELATYGISGVFHKKGEDFQGSLTLLESALRRHRSLRK